MPALTSILEERQELENGVFSRSVGLRRGSDFRGMNLENDYCLLPKEIQGPPRYDYSILGFDAACRLMPGSGLIEYHLDVPGPEGLQTLQARTPKATGCLIQAAFQQKIEVSNVAAALIQASFQQSTANTKAVPYTVVTSGVLIDCLLVGPLFWESQPVADITFSLGPNVLLYECKALDHDTSETTSLVQYQRAEDVNVFLTAHPFLKILLSEAYPEIQKIFGATRVNLEIIEEPETPGQLELFGIIHTALSPQDALARLDKFDEQWWIDNIGRAQGKLNFTVHYD